MLGCLIKIPVGGIMYNDLFKELGVQIEALRIQCEQQDIAYKTQISTLEVAISQQTIQVKKLEEEVKDLGQVKSYLLDERDSLFNALIVLDPTYVPDSVPLDVQGGTPLHNPDILQCEVCEPEPHPYTHPIRDIPESGKVRVKNG